MSSTGSAGHGAPGAVASVERELEVVEHVIVVCEGPCPVAGPEDGPAHTEDGQGEYSVAHHGPGPGSLSPPVGCCPDRGRRCSRACTGGDC